MDEVDFTDDEICKELADLGYTNIPAERFQQFKNELFSLIRQERSHSNSMTSSDNSLSYSVGPARQPHEGKENVIASSSRSYRQPVGQISDLTGHTADEHPGHPNVLFNRATTDGQARMLELNHHHHHHVPKGFAEQAAPPGIMKRKTLRKVDGHVSISESFAESETDDVSELQERLRCTTIHSRARPMSAPPAVHHTISSSSKAVAAEQHHRPHTACREPSLYNLPEDYHGPKALIRPMSCDPHVKNIKKNDPVARYQEYRHCWMACRAPGEKAHKQLRWGVREKMLYRDQVVEKKPQRSYQPNSYVAPGEKKRKTLRWQIRMDLAQGVKPPSMFD